MNKLSLTSHLSKINDWLKNIGSNIGLLPDFSIQPIPGDASIRKYYLLQSNSESKDQQFIVMQTPTDASMTNFVNIANYLSDLALSVNIPKIFAVNNSKKISYLLLSYLGDQLLYKLLNTNNAKSIYKVAWQALIKIQLKANSINLPLMDRAYIKKNLLLFKSWYLETHLKLHNLPNIDYLLNNLENYFVNIFNSQPQVFVHVDYHSRNLILEPNATATGLQHSKLAELAEQSSYNVLESTLGILDFQDAMYGPITYDIGSLLQDAYLVWPEDLVENILLDYFNCLTEHNLFKEPFQQFLKYFYITVLQRHVKNLGIFARLKYFYKKPSYLQYIPNLLNYINNICNKFNDPELTMLKNLIICK